MKIVAFRNNKTKYCKRYLCYIQNLLNPIKLIKYQFHIIQLVKKTIIVTINCFNIDKKMGRDFMYLIATRNIVPFSTIKTIIPVLYDKDFFL